MQAETKFKNHVLKQLKKLPRTYVLKTQEVGRRGVPDLIICCAGSFVSWELKTDHGVLSPIQEHTLQRISEASGWASVVTPSNLGSALETLAALACAPSDSLTDADFEERSKD